MNRDDDPVFDADPTPIPRYRYRIEDVPLPGDPPSFMCPECGAVSYHPEDVRNGYCGRCHQFIEE